MVGNIFELKNNIFVQPVVEPTTTTFDTVPTNYRIIDTFGYESLTWVINIGAINTIVEITFEFKHGNEPDLADGEVCTNNDLITDYVVDGQLIVPSTDDHSTWSIGYIGKKRYCNFNCISRTATITPGIPVCFLTLFTTSHRQPVPDIVTHS